jgi:hypothetical protein
MHLTDERVAAAELAYLADTLQPPCQVGAFSITGRLARSATALLFTVRGGLFGADEGVLKLTGSAYAPILARELALLREAAAAGVDGIVRPLAHDPLWLMAGGDRADRPVAAVALPFLAGGDLATLAARASRTGRLGAALALEVARPVGEALRGLLTELDRPVAHGDVRAQNVLLPSPAATPADLVLIDLDAARELGAGLLSSAARHAALSADVRGFGEIMALLASGSATPPTTGDRPFDNLVGACLAEGEYTSMADPRLWRDLATAEHHQARRARINGRGWLGDLVARIRR